MGESDVNGGAPKIIFVFVFLFLVVGTPARVGVVGGLLLRCSFASHHGAVLVKEKNEGRGGSLTVDPAKHAAHLLEVAVIEEPDARVVLILLERNCKGKAGRGGDGLEKVTGAAG